MESPKAVSGSPQSLRAEAAQCVAKLGKEVGVRVSGHLSSRRKPRETVTEGVEPRLLEEGRRRRRRRSQALGPRSAREKAVELFEVSKNLSVRAVPRVRRRCQKEKPERGGGGCLPIAPAPAEFPTTSNPLRRASTSAMAPAVIHNREKIKNLRVET